MQPQSPQAIVSEIFDLYDRYGHDAYGESVTQLEHMVQSAQLAEQEGYDQEVILAVFFHDIGHLCEPGKGEQMGGFGAQQHDKIGGDFLRQRGFSERMARLVESHVEAKRYLTYRYPDYYATLSEASKQTLAYQGGSMNPEEAATFEQDDLFELIIRMRYWDDEAKIPDRPILEISYYRQMCLDYLEQ